MSTALQAEATGFDAAARRRDFPALAQEINGSPLVYLDNAASAQVPECVISEISRYQREDHANVHRGVHTLSHRATEVFENARESARSFISAGSTSEVVFTRGTTDAINLVAHSFCRPRLSESSNIVITHLEHHSNIVPWQLVCEQSGAELRVARIDSNGQVDAEHLLSQLDERTCLLAIAHVSNALGTVLPVNELIRTAHDRGIAVLIDGAQAVPHLEVNVTDLDADFYAFSAHKMFGPTGVGVLYGKESHLDAMPPYQGGGDMILEVRFSGTTYNELPFKFEAGTPNISGTAGFAAAIAYLQGVGMQDIFHYEHELLGYLTARLESIDGIKLIGTADDKASVQSFMLGDVHPHDVGTILDHQGVAIRTGHHCAMPVMDFFGVPGTARASLAFYNTPDDVDRLVDALLKADEIFRE